MASSMLPLSDDNAWYYPSHGHHSEDEGYPVYTEYGNWGKKNSREARWIRRGKMTAWGPGMDDWEVRGRVFI